MTTQVSASAHCSSDKEVVVQVLVQGALVEEFVLQDGETKEVLAYDDRVILTFERAKPKLRAVS